LIQIWIRISLGCFLLRDSNEEIKEGCGIILEVLTEIDAE